MTDTKIHRLEKSDRLGGVFSSKRAYPNLHLTISNWAMAFSDFPDPQRLCYPSGDHYLKYLQAYSSHFELESHITYNSEIVSARRTDDRRWSLEVRKNGNNDSVRMQCDALIVATGANSVPKQRPAGLEAFQGRVFHSTDYDQKFKDEVLEKKLRVLVVGGGESGADVSAELADLSPRVSVWLRRIACVGPRYLNSKNEMQQVAANEDRKFPANGFLEAATTNRMSAAINVYTYGLFRRILWKMPILNRTLSRMCLDSTTAAWLMNDQATYVTKNQRMCEAIHDDKLDLLVTSSISAEGSTVRFNMADGTIVSREFDAMVLCNGYTAQFPWLQIPGFDSNPRSWFLHCFPKNLGESLFFIGYARPHQGGIPAMADILSRYVAQVVAGERKLPDDYAEQARQNGIAEREYYYISPDLHILVDYNAFLESVARRIGCEPRLPIWATALVNLHLLATAFLLVHAVQPDWNVLGFPLALAVWISTIGLGVIADDGMLAKWLFYPCWGVYYRQRGPGAKPELLQDALRRVPFWSSTAVTRGFILLLLWIFPAFYIQRFLSIAIFCVDKVLARFGVRNSRALGGLLRPKMFALHGTEWRLSDLFLLP